MAATAALGFITILIALYIQSSYRRRQLPPGPRPLPIIGNLHQIPSQKIWLQFRRWHEIYGPIISIQFGQQTMVILGSYEYANELLGKRSKMYSSRPALFSQLAGKAPHTLFLPSTLQWRSHRRIHAEFLSPRASQRYHALQDLESKQLMHELIASNDFAAGFHRYSASLAYSLAYGKRMLTGTEIEVEEIERIVRELFQTINPVLTSFPILNYLPELLAPWKQKSRLLHEEQERVFLKNTQRALRAPSWNWTIAASHAKEAQRMEPTERAWVTGITFEAASDTTSLTMEFVIRACVIYRDAVRAVQAELDSVVGPQQLPQVEHLAKLPYLHAFIKEVYRMFPTSPGFGVFHAAGQDDEYMGYKIPKGAAVVTNNYSCAFDSETFADPWSFNPQRWITDPTLPSANFGYGRRICPGMHMAQHSVRMLTARLLWGFCIEPVVEESGGSGKALDPFDIVEGLLSRPRPFKAQFALRSPQHQAVIERDWQDCEKDVDVILNGIGSEARGHKK